jgi:ABC-type transport system involved in multi-copper enzyme maturation permease subunit
MLTPLLAALLLVWIVAPLPVGYLLFTRKDIR